MDSFEQRNETATKKSSQTSNKAITQSFDTLKLETFPEEGSSIPLVANSTENEEAKNQMEFEGALSKTGSFTGEINGMEVVETNYNPIHDASFSW